MSNPIKQKLKNGEDVIGCFARIARPEIAEILTYGGFDFIVVDGEHGMTDDDSIAAVVRAIEAAGGVALVRARSSDGVDASRLLETGALGIHLPQIDGPGSAQRALQAIRYPPMGTRGLATSRQGGYGLTMSLRDYVEKSNKELLVVAQIESSRAIDGVEEIACLPGLDVLFVGLTDLTADLGVPGEYGDPQVLGALTHVRQAASAAGLVLGVPVTDAAMLLHMRALGARYFAANDIRLLGSAARSFLADCGR